MKRFMLGVALGICLLAGGGLGYMMTRSAPRQISPTVRYQCELTRDDARWVLQELLSEHELDREAGHGVYYQVLTRQRVCSLFTAPTMLECNNDGCRAAAMASAQLVMP